MFQMWSRTKAAEENCNWQLASEAEYTEILKMLKLYSLKIASCCGWIENRQLETSVWANHKHLAHITQNTLRYRLKHLIRWSWQWNTTTIFHGRAADRPWSEYAVSLPSTFIQPIVRIVWEYEKAAYCYRQSNAVCVSISAWSRLRALQKCLHQSKYHLWRRLVWPNHPKNMDTFKGDNMDICPLSKHAKWSIYLKQLTRASTRKCSPHATIMWFYVINIAIITELTVKRNRYNTAEMGGGILFRRWNNTRLVINLVVITQLTHAHTQPFNGLLSGTTRVSWC